MAAALWSRSWRLVRTYADPPARWGILLDCAALSWGTALLIAAIAAPLHAGDVLNGNLIGFEAPAATLIGWVALALGTGAVLSHPRVVSLLKRKPFLVSLVSLLVLGVVGEGLVRCWTVIDPEVQAFPTHRTEMWLKRYAQLNAAGFRQGGRSGSGATRQLLVLGDSYAFGWGIERTRERMGEIVAGALDTATGTRWDAYNVSRPDLDTRQEIDLLSTTAGVHPDVALIVYVFNDIEYLEPMTQRLSITEAPSGLLDRLNPQRMLFANSFLAQELYVRGRHASLVLAGRGTAQDPYADSTKVASHLKDVCRLVRATAASGALTALVPLDIAPVLSPRYQARMDNFVRQARAAGIPVLRVDSAFAGHSFADLAVNTLDAHPNELANRLAAQAVSGQLVPMLWGVVRAKPVTCRE
jgi:hypothetical protein